MNPLITSIAPITTTTASTQTDFQIDTSEVPQQKFEEALSEEKASNTTAAIETTADKTAYDMDSESIDIKNNAAATNTEATVETTQRPFNKSQKDLSPLEKLPTELLLNVLEHLSSQDLARASVRSARIKELADVIFIDRMDSAQKFIARCIQHDLNRYQLPGKETLLNIARKNISEEIYLLWAKTENSSSTHTAVPNAAPNVDIPNAEALAPNALAPNLPNNAADNTTNNTGKRLAKKITSDLFKALQKKLPGPLIPLLQQGKLSASQWQSWIQRIHDMGDEAPVGPFPFHKKIEQFLNTALVLKNNKDPEKMALINDVEHILLALRDGHLNETQLDQWMRNPGYDLGVISELCQRMSPSLNTEQIIALEKLVVEETKFFLARNIRRIWTQSNFLEGHACKNMRARLAALEASNSVLDLETLDKFITEKVNTVLLAQDAYDALHNKNVELFLALTPHAITFLEELTQGNLHAKISYRAIFILMSNGFSFKDALDILDTENHQDKIRKDSITYLRQLSVIAYAHKNIDDIKNFGKDKLIDRIFIEVLHNEHGDNYNNRLRTSLDQGKIQFDQLKQLILSIFNTETKSYSTDAWHPSRINVLKNILPVLGVERFSNFEPYFYKHLEVLSKSSNDPKAIEAWSDLKVKMGPQLHDWLNIAKDNLSLPMAMQAAYASGIDLKKTTLKIQEKNIFTHTHVAPVIRQLFGHRMWEYSTDITQALSQKLISPEDIEQHFLLPSGYFSESKNTQEFCSHVLPRILKKEITFKEVIASLDQLNTPFKEFWAKRSADYLPSTYIRLFCHGVPVQDLYEFISHKQLDFLQYPRIKSCLEDQTLPLKTLLRWIKDDPCIPPKRIENFHAAFVLVRAGKLDLDTLERWIRNPSINPKPRQLLFFESSDKPFDCLIAQQLSTQQLRNAAEEQAALPPLSNADRGIALKQFKTLETKFEALDTAKEIDRYIKNSLQQKGA